jgi:hypothetical protein
MKTVWKAKISPNSVSGDVYPIRVPARQGAVPLRVMVQDGEVFFWFKVDTDAKPANLILYCVGTGHGRVPDGGTYLDSVIDGAFVWHFYY